MGLLHTKNKENRVALEKATELVEVATSDLDVAVEDLLRDGNTSDFVDVVENLHGIADTLNKCAEIMKWRNKLAHTGGHGRRRRIESQIKILIKQIS